MQPQPFKPPVQQALPLGPVEPSPQQLRHELQRMYLASLHWRRVYRSLDALLADPKRAAVLQICARQAVRARARARRPMTRA